MARVKVYSLVDTRLDIFDKSDRLVDIENISDKNLKVKELNNKTLIKDLSETITLTDVQERTAVAETILPFKVKFTNIDIPGYGPSNVPPIGIAIIGVNNFIL